MMYHRFVALFGVIVFSLWGQTTLAAAIALNPPASTIDAGATFDLAFELDASDAPGPHPGNFCGEVRIDYDPSLLTFVASSDALQVLDSETLADGRAAISFGFSDVIFNSTPDAGVVGLFTFQANGRLGSATVGIEDNLAGVGGSFSNHADPASGNPTPPGTPSAFPIAAASATVQVVPIPAAAWLFISALGALGFIGRKSRTKLPTH